MNNFWFIWKLKNRFSWDFLVQSNYSQLSPCGYPAITDTRYYGQNPDPRRKL